MNAITRAERAKLDGPTVTFTLDGKEVEARAGGRVFTGRDAHTMGLVDHLGGLTVAIERARDLARLPVGTAALPLRPPRRLPEPPEPPPVLEPIVSRLDLPVELIALWMGSKREQVYALDDRLV